MDGGVNRLAGHEEAAISGQVVIVTGASRGVGRAVARRLCADGARVIAVARNREQLETLRREAAVTGEIVPVAGDVRDPRTAAAAVAVSVERFGHVDALVNNAGVERTRPLEQVPDSEYDMTLDTNLRRPFNFARAVIQPMKKRGAGSIVTIASVAAIRGFVDDAVYTASKFGALGLSDALEEELRPYGIRVCVICPGAINTDLAKETWSPPEDPYRPHFLQPHDLADAVAWVLGQPPRVAVSRIVLRPLVEPPYGQLLARP